jgi:hypothetical protein
VKIMLGYQKVGTTHREHEIWFKKVGTTHREKCENNAC